MEKPLVDAEKAFFLFLFLQHDNRMKKINCLWEQSFLEANDVDCHVTIF